MSACKCNAGKGRLIESKFSQLGHLGPFFLFSVAIVTYISTIDATFLTYDDTVYVTRNEVAKRGITVEALYSAVLSLEVYWHPLTWFSHNIDIEIFGLDPCGHHLVSVILHALVATGLLRLAQAIVNYSAAALAAAALWALHPLRVESVAWIAERKDVLSGVFGLLALLTYLWFADKPSGNRIVAVGAALALALMTKPTMVMLPLLFLLLDWWPLKRSEPWRKLIVEKLPFFAMSGAVGVLTVMGQKSTGALDLLPNVDTWLRIQNAVVSVATYLCDIVWPSGLACFYPYPSEIPLWKFLGSLGLVLLISGIGVWQRHTRPYLLFGWLWFLVMLLPTLGLLQAGRQSMADRFTYWPMMGLVIAVALTADELRRRWPKLQRPLAVSAAVAILAFAGLSHRQTHYWKDSRTLFERALAVTSDNEYMRGNLGMTLLEEGDLEGAERHLKRAAELAPSMANHAHNLSLVRYKRGLLDPASSDARRAVSLDATRSESWELLATIEFRRNQPAAAADALERAVAQGHEAERAAARLNDEAVLLAKSGRFADAEILLRRAIALQPKLVDAHRNLIYVLVDQGKRAEARTHLQRAMTDTLGHAAIRNLAGTI